MGVLGRSWALLARSWVAFGRSWGALGSLLGRSWELLGEFWGMLGALGGSWGALGALLGDFVLISVRILFDFCSISRRFGNDFARSFYLGGKTPFNFLNFQTSEN